MTRRFQFRLRTLLGLSAIICIVLGGWSLVETYGTSVDAGDPRVGAPIRIKGRYFWLFGPDECVLAVGHSWPEEDGSVAKYLRARRAWLCLYSVEYDFKPVDRPGQIEVSLSRHEGSTCCFVKEKIVDVK